MKRHVFDPLSFVFGIIFVALAGVLSADGLRIGVPGLRWFGALILLVLGVVMLLGTRSRSDDRS